jgi:hypothetical protein
MNVIKAIDECLFEFDKRMKGLHSSIYTDNCPISKLFGLKKARELFIIDIKNRPGLTTDEYRIVFWRNLRNRLQTVLRFNAIQADRDTENLKIAEVLYEHVSQCHTDNVLLHGKIKNSDTSDPGGCFLYTVSVKHKIKIIFL